MIRQELLKSPKTLNHCPPDEPLGAYIKRPRLGTNTQEAVAGLTLLQHGVVGQQQEPVTPVALPYSEVPGTDGNNNAHTSGGGSWAPYSAVNIPNMTRMQRKAARKAAKLLQASGLIPQSSQPLAVVDFAGQALHCETPTNDHLLSSSSSLSASYTGIVPAVTGLTPAPTAAAPLTYPYMCSPTSGTAETKMVKTAAVAAAVPKNTPSKASSTKADAMWGRQVSPTGPTLASPDLAVPMSDPVLETLQAPDLHAPADGQAATLDPYHGCAVMRCGQGGVIPSVEIIPCVPYIPSKRPETFTEAASMYIDFLIQENENLVHISHCEFREPFTAAERVEFLQAALAGPCHIPSEKFRAWLKQFNVDVEVVSRDANDPPEMEEDDLEDLDNLLFMSEMAAASAEAAKSSAAGGESVAAAAAAAAAAAEAVSKDILKLEQQVTSPSGLQVYHKPDKPSDFKAVDFL